MIKKYIKKALLKFGYNIERYKKYFDFKYHNINCVLDVGAHLGQFAKKIRNDGYDLDIISFEPQIEIYKKIKEASKNDDRWKIFPRCALGKSQGKDILNIFSETQCSSILKPNQKFFDHDQSFKQIDTTECDVYNIEYIFDLEKLHNKNIFLKIDTQGYESEVLEGCGEKINLINFIQLELCTYNLYFNEKKYDYYFDYLKKRNYELFDIKPFAYDKHGRLMQFDCLFKNKLLNNRS